MHRSTIVAAGLIGLTGCVSADDPAEPVDYVLPSGVAIGEEVLVAMERREPFQPDQIDVTTVRSGEPDPLSPAVVGPQAFTRVGSPQLAEIDGQAYLAFYADSRYRGAPLGPDGTIDPGAIVDLGYNPALTRVGNRFAAVSFPQQPLIVIFVPAATFHATFVRPDGQRDGELDIATEASPLGTIGLIPRCAGNAKLLALLFKRQSFFGSSELRVARVSDAGALLEPDGVLIASSGGLDGASGPGDAQLTVTADGGVLVVYGLYDHGASSIHATRIEPGPSPAISDLVTDLVTVPSFLVTSGDQILAVSAPAMVPPVVPTFETLETRILDGRGKTVSGPVAITTGDQHASVIATADGFAVLHSGIKPQVRLTAIGRDGQPGDTVTLATSKAVHPSVDPGGCSIAGGRSAPGMLVLVLGIGWLTVSAPWRARGRR
jgi:hypothetical protein